jgi:hypothetical protein
MSGKSQAGTGGDGWRGRAMVGRMAVAARPPRPRPGLPQKALGLLPYQAERGRQEEPGMHTVPACYCSPVRRLGLGVRLASCSWVV